MNKVIEDIYCFFIGLLVIFVIWVMTPRIAYGMFEMQERTRKKQSEVSQ